MYLGSPGCPPEVPRSCPLLALSSLHASLWTPRQATVSCWCCPQVHGFRPGTASGREGDVSPGVPREAAQPPPGHQPRCVWLLSGPGVPASVPRCSVLRVGHPGWLWEGGRGGSLWFCFCVTGESHFLNLLIMGTDLCWKEGRVGESRHGDDNVTALSSGRPHDCPCRGPDRGPAGCQVAGCGALPGGSAPTRGTRASASVAAPLLAPGILLGPAGDKGTGR